MELKVLLDSKESLKELSNKDIPISLGYKIKTLLDKFDNYESLYKQKVRSLYERLGDKQDSDSIIIKKENEKEFDKELNIIHKEEVLEDIELHLISLSSLMETNINIKPSTLFELSWLMEEM